MTMTPDWIELATVGSTNDAAKDRARDGAAHGTVIRAEEQTKGRGRQGNGWSSPQTGNVYMTRISRPVGKSVSELGQLSFVAAVAMARFLRELGIAAVLKWPNDVLVSGKKISGILLETETGSGAVMTEKDWVVTGIGVNVVTAPAGAIALRDTGVDIDCKTAARSLASHLAAVEDIWMKDGFENIRQAWLSHADVTGKTIRIRLPQETFYARVLGLDTSGALQVETENGTRRDIASGEVFAI